MRPNRTSRDFDSLLGFRYPRAHYGKNVYVDFYVFDPATETMRRVKKFFDNISSKREQKRQIAEYIEVMSTRLRQGYNPFVSTDNNRGYTLFVDVLSKYEESLSKGMRAKTVHSYTSRLNILREYIESRQLPIKFAYQFDSTFCIDFLDWVLYDRDLSARTRNNYRQWLGSVAEWMKARKYITENPTDCIKKMPEEEKKRQPLTPDQMKRVVSYLEEHDRHFLLAVLMEYFTFIRPTELSYLKIRDISVKKMNVFVPAQFSKNHKNGTVSLNEKLVTLMIDLGVLTRPGDWFLFGRHFYPSAEHFGADQFNKSWAKLRKKLGRPLE